jgi:hypothetical protein
LPITNLAIQRRRVHELHELMMDRELELFSIELSTASQFYDQRVENYHSFFIHGRKITPQIVHRLNAIGFSISEVKALNDYTLIIEVSKWPTEQERPGKRTQ